MNTYNEEFRPIRTDIETGRPPKNNNEAAFLKAVADGGFEAFHSGKNDYVARSNQREGCILERGRARWEIRLAEGDQRRLLAYVGQFEAAGHAVTAWLQGAGANDIVLAIEEQLVIPAGETTSFTISERSCAT